MHKKYGNVVRVAPNELTYTAPGAWKEIHGHRPSSQPPFTIDPKFYKVISGDNIITSGPEDHHRLRRLLSNGFSERSIRDQEPIIKQYVDLLIHRLHEKCTADHGLVDLVPWYNWTTFDIIGDLAFGEPFGCLDNVAYHPWVELVCSNLRTSPILRGALYYPYLRQLFLALAPKSSMEQRQAFHQLTKEKVAKRIESQDFRPDFFGHIIRNKKKLACSTPFLANQAN